MKKSIATRMVNRLKLENKANWEEGVKKTIRGLQHKGLSLEQMAVDLMVRKETIWSWLAGRRTPRFATIRFIETLYGVKII